MRQIKIVTIIGANGTIGSQCAGLIAGFGNSKVYMVARDQEKAESGKKVAMDSIKSDSISERLVPKTYSDLKDCLKESDWVFELIAEDFDLKSEINKLIAKYKKPKSIVSTVTSGLSISKLSKIFNKEEKSYYFGTHFFNPPYKMLLCELISHEESDITTQKFLAEYLEKVLLRKVVQTKDKPGFAANRIGFQLLNELAQYAEKYKDGGGIAYIDSVIGNFTGRALPPMATIDLVGLDIHKAIVDNLHNETQDPANSTFKLPDFIKILISKGDLGNKTSKGLYQIKDGKHLYFNITKSIYEPVPKYDLEVISNIKKLIASGEYKKAIEYILNSSREDAEIIQYFFARYISYSYSLIGEVVRKKEDIDRVMGYGFNWVPPSALIDLIGGKERTIELIKKFDLPIPKELSDYSMKKLFYTLQGEMDYRSFFKTH